MSAQRWRAKMIRGRVEERCTTKWMISMRRQGISVVHQRKNSSHPAMRNTSCPLLWKYFNIGYISTPHLAHCLFVRSIYDCLRWETSGQPFSWDACRAFVSLERFVCWSWFYVSLCHNFQLFALVCFIISCLMFVFRLLFLFQLKSTRSASHILPCVEPDYDNTNSSIFKSRNICRMCSSLWFISNLHINPN